MRMTAALLVGLLALSLAPALSGTAASSNHASVVLAPALEGSTAVRNGQDVRISGTAPSGAQIDAARLVGSQADGGTVDQVVSQAALNRGPVEGNYLRNNNGTLEGQIRLLCQFGPPGGSCPAGHDHVRRVHIEITIAGQPVTSNELRVDYVRPFVRRHELVAPNRIRVVFSEPVRHTRGESTDDWQISDPDRTVLRIEGPTSDDCTYEPGEDATAGPTGCTRTLVFLGSVDEDATPYVQPRVRTTVPISEAGQYQDYAANGLLLVSGAAHSNALDRIRPPLPRIEAVEGSEPDGHNRTTGDTSAPSVTVSNLRAGHTVHVEVEGERVLSEAATGSSHTARLPDLGSGDEFMIRVVVEDPHGNLSTQGHLHAARSDASPSQVCYGVGALCALDTLPGPKVLDPPATLYTRDTSPTIRGVVEPTMEGIEVDLRDRTTGLDLATTTTDAEGRWSFATSLDLERRYRYEVVTRDGDRTVAAPVPDIVLDRTNPSVQVVRPAPDPTVLTLDETSSQVVDARPRRHGGDGVDITWLAADPALLDLENLDHGSHVDIDVVFSDGPRRTIADGLPYTPLTQTHGYHISTADVLGTQREAVFDVTVTDLAGNDATASSYPIVIDGTIIGYEAWFVQNDPDQSVIEARFDVPLVGTTTPAEWRIDDVPARTAAMRSQDGGTIVTLVASQSISDPNATPPVQFTPLPVNTNRLRGEDGREVRTTAADAFDKIPPALSISLPDPGPLHAESVTVTGRTDETEWPNTIRASRDGQVVGQTTAGEDGRFSLTVPLDPDRVNEVVVEAVDPSSNLSPAQAFQVIEDSTPPVVVIDNPVSDSAIPRALPIRWTTIDNNPDVVDIEYRVGTGDWQPLVGDVPDQGSHHWRIPDSIPDDAVLALRITATDQVGHRGNPSTVRTLRLSLDLLAACEDVDPAPFADRERVPEVHRFAVDCLYALGIAKGAERGGELHFDPQTDISRAQFSGFLHRSLEHAAIGLPGPADRFADVPEGHTFDVDIHELAAAAVILGYDERHFGPRDPIKRDQTASLLLRAVEYARDEEILPESGSYFADTAASAHVASIDAAYEQGLVVGRTAPSAGNPGIYDPGALTTRAQMATVLVRALGQFDR